LEQSSQRADVERLGGTTTALAARATEGDEGDDAVPAAGEDDGEDAAELTSFADHLRHKPTADVNRRLMTAVASGSQQFASSMPAAASRMVLYSSQCAAALSMASTDETLVWYAGSGLEEDVGGSISLPSDDGSGLASIMMRCLTLSDQDVPLSSLRTRVVVLLGRLGGDARHVLGSYRDLLHQEVTWGGLLSRRATKSRLTLDIPADAASTATYTLYLDTLLPRATVLATSAVTRQTKIAACEFVHAMTLLMVGQIATDPNVLAARAGSVPRGGGPGTGDALSRTDHFGFFSHVFPVCMSLAVDPEPVCQQLFAPLTMQLVRFLSLLDGYEETEVAMQCVMSSLGDGDARMRTFAAACFADFVAYTIRLRPRDAAGPARRGGGGGGGGGSVAASRPDQALDRMFSRMFACARHTSALQRLGACLAWNACYRSLREEPALATRYICAITDHMVQALTRSGHDAASMHTGVAVAAAAAVDHCERILVKFAPLLSMPDASRPTTSPADLSQLVVWLWLRCGLAETQARRKCMQLFEALAPLVQWHGARSSLAVGQGARAAVGSGVSPFPSMSDASRALTPAWSAAERAAAVTAWIQDFKAGGAGISAAYTALAGGGTVGDWSMPGLPATLHRVRPGGADSPLHLAEAWLLEWSQPLGTGAGDGGTGRPWPVPGKHDAMEHMAWCAALSAALDTYTWLISRGYLPVADVATALRPPAPSSAASGAASSGSGATGKKRKRGDEDGGGAVGGGSSVDAAHHAVLGHWCRHFLSQLCPLVTAAGDTDTLDEWVGVMLTPGSDLTADTVAAVCKGRATVLCRMFTLATALLRCDGAASAPAASCMQACGVTDGPFFRILLTAMGSPAVLAVEDDDAASSSAGGRGGAAGGSGAGAAGLYIPRTALGVLTAWSMRRGAGAWSALQSAVASLPATDGEATVAVPVAGGGMDLRMLPGAIIRNGAVSAASLVGVGGRLDAGTTLEEGNLTFGRVRELARLALALHQCGLLDAALASPPAAPRTAKAKKARGEVRGDSGADSVVTVAGLAASDHTALTSAASLASALGTAAWCLPATAHPAAVRCAAAGMDLAMALGWKWNTAAPASHPGLLSIAECMGMAASSTASRAEGDALAAACRLFVSRFRRRLVPYLLRVAVFVDAAVLYGEAGEGDDAMTGLRRPTSAATSDARLHLASYPVFGTLIDQILRSTAAAAAGDAPIAAPTAPSRTPAAAASAEAVAEVEAANWRVDEAWRTVRLLVQAVITEKFADARTSSRDAGAAATTDADDPAAVAVDAYVAASSLRGLRVRLAVVVNGMLACLQSLAVQRKAWEVAEAAKADRVWSMVWALLHTLVRCDPWLLLTAPSAARAGGRGGDPPHPSKQVRELPAATSELVVAALQRTSARVAVDAASMAGTLRRIDRFAALLPYLLPGYTSTSPVSASIVVSSDLGVPGGVGPGSGGGRRISSLHATAVRCVRELIGRTFPVHSRELVGPTHAERGRVFVHTVRALWDAFAATGSLALLRLLHPCLQEGEGHTQYGHILASLATAAEAMPRDGPSAVAVVTECLSQCFAIPPPVEGMEPVDGRGMGVLCPLLRQPRVQSMLTDALLIPLLQRITPAALKDILLSRAFFTSLQSACAEAAACAGVAPPADPAAALVDVRALGCMGPGQPPPTLLHYLMNAAMDRDLFSVTTHADGNRATRLANGLQIVATLFDGLDVEAVRGDCYRVYREALPSSGPTPPKDNQLFADLSRHARGFIAGKPKPRAEDVSHPDLLSRESLRLRQCAFLCLVAGTKRTQSQYRHLHTLLFNETNGPLWSQLADTTPHVVVRNAAGLITGGGLPFFDVFTAFRRSRVQYDKAMVAASVLAESWQMVADGGGDAMGGGGGGATLAGGGGSGGWDDEPTGPLSQAHDFARLRADVERADGGVGVGLAIAGGGRVGPGAGGGVTLLGEGADEGFTASQAPISRRGSFDDADGGPAAARTDADGDSSMAPSLEAAAVGGLVARAGGGVGGGRLPTVTPALPSVQMLDLDYFNTVPTMPAVLRVLDHISAKGVVEAEWRATAWSDDLAKCARSSSTPLPVRLFLVKVVLNRPRMFRPHQHTWTPILLAAMLELRETAVSGGQWGWGMKCCATTNPTSPPTSAVRLGAGVHHRQRCS